MAVDAYPVEMRPHLVLLGSLALVACSSSGSSSDASDAATPGLDASDSSSTDSVVEDTAPPPGSRSVTFAPSDAAFPNPERGFYDWAADDFGKSIDLGVVDTSVGAGLRLFYAKVELGAFRTTDLPKTFLDALSTRLQQLRAHGGKAVLRFAYDYTDAGNDAPAAQIVKHVGQLKPLLAGNADAIAHLQAGFIGAYGEWHSSKNSNSYGYMTNPGVTEAIADANRLLVRDALLAAAPPGMPIEFRYPGDLIKWYPSPTTEPRVGMHNDCFLAGPTDTGTYEAAGEREYVATRSALTPFGGETCDADTPLRTACKDILAEGARYHLSYLNQAYYKPFLDAWRAGGCFDEVARRIGYRLQLDALAYPEKAPKGSVTVQVRLRNVGWSRLWSARPLVVTLRSASRSFQAKSAVGLNTLEAQGATSAAIAVAIPVDVAGEYEVWLSAPDVFDSNEKDARFSVRFANADVGKQRWDPTTAAFDTGASVVIE